MTLPPTDDMSHAMQEALQRAKDELVANSTKVTDPDLQNDLNAIVDEAVSSTLARNLGEVIDAERIEEFRPRGILGVVKPLEFTAVPDLPDEHPAAGHTSISLPKSEAFARGEHPMFDMAEQERIQQKMAELPDWHGTLSIGGGQPTELSTCRATAPCARCQARMNQDILDNPRPAEQPEHRTLLQIVGQHRAVAQASTLEIYELVAELQPLIRSAENSRILAGIGKDAVAGLRRMREEFQRSRHVGWSDDYDPDSSDARRASDLWDRQHPEVAALLRAVDGD